MLEEIFGETGDLIFKPLRQWQTFWNAGDTPARILEIISPAGLEELFRQLGTAGGSPDAEALAGMEDRCGCEADSSTRRTSSSGTD